MAKDEDGAHEPAAEPSFDDPNDPRWSRNPHAAPPRNPYLDMPLDAPPVAGAPNGRGYGFAGQHAGQQAGGQPGYPQQYPAPGYPQPGYPMPAAAPSSVLSIVSLVTGLVGFFSAGMILVPQIVAVICGHMALKREPHARGMAIAGLVLGYLSLAFLGLMVLFVMVALGGLY
ncbi:hypothetical protein GCM10009715_29570 [Paeniglutamicibacter psychrophenolicus]|uniref:DUF4190 domain-containing protein n=1 Tax=Paeniglutamicibacter psychrophenolicus TaxID=257454 RepID=A0ABS4W8L3_9MICC|nr:DUF4190 domain-containing protein [Paeniglutamicibacter psychrophenolicus]MBP2372541.1 hypothetical protein [Paeniglutamicibacter psychrophenolicus]